MTTIVGIQGDGFSVICADSRIVSVAEDGSTSAVSQLGNGTSKVSQNGPYLLGAAGDVRAINILHHAFQPPTPPNNLRGKKLDAFITVKFIPALRECFEKQGYASPGRDGAHIAEQDSTIVVVIHGTIYVIDGDYSWCSDANDYYAVGSGSDYALGALHILMHLRKGLTVQATKAIATKAIATAAKYDVHTGAPYHTYIQESSGIKQKTGTTPKSSGKKVSKDVGRTRTTKPSIRK